MTQALESVVEEAEEPARSEFAHEALVESATVDAICPTPCVPSCSA